MVLRVLLEGSYHTVSRQQLDHGILQSGGKTDMFMIRGLPIRTLGLDSR